MPLEPFASGSIEQPGGRRVAYSELGDPSGYPVLWCHGGLSSRVDVILASEPLAGLGVRVVSADRPGIGESDRQRDRSVADWPLDAAAIADELGLDRFAIVGWSAGGPFALACAAALSGRVSAVATIGGMAPVRNRADVKALGLAGDRVLVPLAHRAPWAAGAMLQAARRVPPQRLKRQTLRALPLPDRAFLDPLPPELAVGYAIAALRHGTHGTVDDYRAFGGGWGFDPQDVGAPVRCWRGAEDTLVPVADTRRLVDALPTGRMHEVPAAGHFLFATHTADVFGALLDDAGA